MVHQLIEQVNELLAEHPLHADLFGVNHRILEVDEQEMVLILKSDRKRFTDTLPITVNAIELLHMRITDALEGGELV